MNTNNLSTIDALVANRDAVAVFVNDENNAAAGTVITHTMRVLAKLDRDGKVFVNGEKIAQLFAAMGAPGERLLDWAQGHLHSESWVYVATVHQNIVAPRLEDVIA